MSEQDTAFTKIHKYTKKYKQSPASPDSNSLESASSTVRRARRVTYAQDIVSSKSKSALLRYELRRKHRGREVSKTYVRGGMVAWRNIIDFLSEEEGSDWADLIRGWIQQAAGSGGEGAEHLILIWKTNPFNCILFQSLHYSESSRKWQPMWTLRQVSWTCFFSTVL